MEERRGQGYETGLCWCGKRAIPLGGMCAIVELVLMMKIASMKDEVPSLRW